jgi:hypothetical protein
MKYAIEMGLSFVKIGSGIQKLRSEGFTDTDNMVIA